MLSFFYEDFFPPDCKVNIFKLWVEIVADEDTCFLSLDREINLLQKKKRFSLKDSHILLKIKLQTCVAG